jgi:hypothetical protein
MVPASDDCPTTLADGGGLVVNPQRPGVYHGIAISDGKPVTFAVVCEAEQGGASLASKAWGKVKGAASKVGPVAKPVATFAATFALGAALTLAPRGCEILPDWLRPHPNPPGPVDPPKPPQPPAPIVGDGLRVLVVLESADLSKLDHDTGAELNGKTLADYLNATCAKGPDGKSPEWRIWDKDVPLSEVSQTWKDAMARPRSSLPWLTVSNGKTGYEGPLPKTGILDKIKAIAEAK